MAAVLMESGTALVRGPRVAGVESVLTPEALALLTELHRRFDGTRQALLAARKERQKRFDAGELPGGVSRRCRRPCRTAGWRLPDRSIAR
jgi:malate synthase